MVAMLDSCPLNLLHQHLNEKTEANVSFAFVPRGARTTEFVRSLLALGVHCNGVGNLCEHNVSVFRMDCIKAFCAATNA